MWPFTETSGTTIHDVVGSNNGTISGGFTYEGGVGVFCNPATGNGCNITTPTTYTNAQPFSFIFKFSGVQGGLIQLANPSSQTAAPVFYAAYLDNFGRLTFGVLNYGLDYVIQSKLPYADGNIHVAMVTIGSAGMKMYVDGKIVAHRTVQLANYTAGKWFFGGMNQSGWPYSPSSAYFSGTLYCMGWWNGAQLSDFVAEQATLPFPPPIPNNYCSFTGNIASLAQPPGYAYANQAVTLQTFQTQGPACGGTSPIAPSFQTYTTDSQGNLPSGIFIQQGAHLNMSIGYGAPIPLVAPCASTCPLANFFPTPTATPTPSPSATPTISATATITATATPTPIPLACISGGQQIETTISTCGGTGTATLNVRAGDSLYVAAGNNGTGASQVTFISDSQGDVWNANDVLNAEGTVQSAAIGSSFNVAGGLTTVTVQIAGGTVCNTNVYLIETPPSNNLDVTAKNQSAAASPFDSGTTAPTYGGSEFVLAVVGQNGNALSTGPSNGFSELLDPANNQSFAACNVVPVNTLANTQWTPITFAGSYAGGIAAYKFVPTATPTGSSMPTATPTPGLPMFVQENGTAVNNGTSMSVPLHAAVNDTVVLFFEGQASGGLSSLVVTGMGAVWTQLGCHLASNNALQDCLYAVVVVSPNGAIDISGLANLPSIATVAEWSGMPITLTQDGSATSGTGTSSPIQPAPYSNTNGRDLLVCNAAISSSGFTGSPSAPWITLMPQHEIANAGQGTYQIVTSNSSFQPQWTGGTAPWTATCAGLEY